MRKLVTCFVGFLLVQSAWAESHCDPVKFEVKIRDTGVCRSAAAHGVGEEIFQCRNYIESNQFAGTKGCRKEGYRPISVEYVSLEQGECKIKCVAEWRKKWPDEKAAVQVVAPPPYEPAD